MSKRNDPPTIVVAGPTASGKSALALDVAEELVGTVINADSMQVYRELRVLTARPSPADEARVPHRLFGVLSIKEPCSAGQWVEMAVEEIEAAWDTGRLPVVVGGTGLYLKSLLGGLAAVPPISAEVRAEARARYERLGGEAFRRELEQWDPQAAETLPANDRQRLIRAYEVVRGTGQPLTTWQTGRVGHVGLRGQSLVLTLLPPREALYEKIEERFDRMIEDGAIDEAAVLASADLDPSLPGLKAVGVRELLIHLRGELTLDEAREAAKRATRQYAKRQYTWLRHQLDEHYVFCEQYSKRLRKKIFPIIRHFLLTAQQ